MAEPRTCPKCGGSISLDVVSKRTRDSGWHPPSPSGVNTDSAGLSFWPR